MKQKDLTLVLVVVFISVVAALIVSRLIFSAPKNSQQTAEKVDVITSEFPLPDSNYFNVESVNPTKQIEIGGSSNPSPFKSNPQ